MAKTTDGSGKDGTKGGGLLMGLILPVLVLTLIASGGGWLIGNQITAAAKTPSPTETPAAEKPSTTAVKELQPIVTNLAAPEGAWVRLQAAVVYDKADAAQIDVLSGKVVDDTVAFIKTLTVAQLQGAAGLQHLREDLNERAGLRSDGHIKEMMIEMLVIE